MERGKFIFCLFLFEFVVMRLDKYLKVSRIIKRRTVANDACDAQHVTVNGREAKASYNVKIDDLIEVTFGQKKLKIKVTSIKDVVAKADAASMYEIIE